MAWQDFFNSTPAPQADPASFNYQTQADIIKRKRAIADMLLQKAGQGQQGQFIKNGDFIGYAGGNTPLSAALQGLTGYLAAKSQSQQDAAQMGLDKNSIAALSYQLQHLNDGTDVPYNAGKDSQAANLVDAGPQVTATNPGTPQMPPQQQIPPQAYSPAGDSQQAYVNMGQGNVPLPLVNPNAAAAVVGAGGGRGGQGGPTADQLQMAQSQAMEQGRTSPFPMSPQTSIVPDIYKKAAASQQPDQQWITDKPTNTGGASGSWDTPQSAAVPQPVPQAGPVPVPQAGPMPVAPPSRAMPDITAQPPAAMPPQAPTSPVAAPQAMPGAQAQAPNPITAANPGMQPATMEQKIARLAALAQTGPAGQQMASSMMQQMFSHSDRYDVKLNDAGDGLVVDKWSGSVQRIPGIGNGLKLNDADMSMRAKVDPNNPQAVAQYNKWRTSNGLQPLDPQTIAGTNMDAGARVTQGRETQKQNLDVEAKLAQNHGAVSAINNQLDNLDRIDELYDKVYTGPGGTLVPEWNSERKELSKRLASDIFAETRSAVQGAGDSGAAPRMAASEFRFMVNNGGLSLDTQRDAAHQLIAQQRNALINQRNAISAYGNSLSGAAANNSASSPPVGAPPRGQTFTGPSATFADRFTGGQQ